MNRPAKYISIIGHPFLTIPVYVIIVMFSFLEFKRAAFISFLIIGFIFVPLSGWMYIKTKRGLYTNFDVSVRTQRKSLFALAVPLMLVVTIVLFITDQPIYICNCVLFSSLLVTISQVVNLFIKSSLHVSLTIFLSFLIIPANLILGLIVLLSSIIIGWSRVKLGRHTVKEVITGFIIGLTLSIAMLFVQQYINP